MPTVFTHILVPLAWRAATRRQPPDRRTVVIAMGLAVLPDADVIAFAAGVPYASPLGHRGFTHSIAFALVTALLALAWLRPVRSRLLPVGIFLFVAAVSHPLLDALTDGGLGVALLWPWSEARWFAPWRPVAVSPIGAHFFGARGVAVLLSELLWIWLPLAVAGVLVRIRR
jgi:inner membrane protein